MTRKATPMSDAELTLWLAAERAMDTYRYEFLERRGGTRAQSTLAAFKADDAVERVHEIAYRFPDLNQRLGIWIALLSRHPEMEKRWLGIREYRETHRVRGDA